MNKVQKFSTLLSTNNLSTRKKKKKKNLLNTHVTNVKKGRDGVSDS